MTTESIVVLIVGAGPAGLATSSCLNIQKIPNIVLEMEDCCASLWKKHSYDPLNLHLAKNFCELPHLPFPLDAPTFMSKSDFTQYLDNYVAHFQINPLYSRVVYSANFNADDGKWLVQVKNKLSRRAEEYVAKFLVVATGENSGGFIPLSNYGGKASIVIRNLGDESLFNEEGMPKKMKPNHWKGDNGLYCAGFSSFGLFGISKDAKMIADDIASHFKNAKP